jgi:hypothetical protein
MSYFAVNPEVITHPTGAEAPFALAVLTTERKAA